MKILVAGAGEKGSGIIKQLKKNKKIELFVLDPRDDPYAIKSNLINKVDFKETLTPLTLDFIIEKCHPDLIILATGSDDLGLGNFGSSDILTNSLREELSVISPVPVIRT